MVTAIHTLEDAVPIMEIMFGGERTVVMAIGKTRTSYIHYRLHMAKALSPDQASYEENVGDPGEINMTEYAKLTLAGYMEQAGYLKRCGFSHIVLTCFHHEAFWVRGEEYAAQLMEHLDLFISPMASEYYRQGGFNPKFIGTDMLMKHGEDTLAYQAGKKLKAFESKWRTVRNAQNLFLELFPIPRYSLFDCFTWMQQRGELESFQAKLDAMPTLRAREELIYRVQSEFVCNGIYLPKPILYVGTAYNGDIKVRSEVAAMGISNSQCRLMFTEFPSLLMTEESWLVILRDFLEGKPIRRSRQLDYSGLYDLGGWETEMERVFELVETNQGFVGLYRRK